MKRTLSFGLIGTLVCPLLMQPASAAVLEEVTVTAQKREQSIQDVPVSITSFSGEQLRELGIDSTLDLGAFTPGLTFGQNTGDGDFPFISLRGVTVRDFADTNESPSAVYIDEFYKANLVGLDSAVFDMQRVEVLRGPQGTLYGRNATGGLIHYVTAKPSREAEAFAEFTYGEYNRVKFEGAVGGPMTDTLSGRLSYLHHEYDGWVKNRFVGNEDGNALNVDAIRAQLLFEPNDDLSFSFLLQHLANDNDAGNMFQHVSATTDPVTGLSVPIPGQPGFAGYVEITPDDPRDTNANRDIALETDQTTAIGRIEWNIGELELVSVTGYEDTAKDASFDSDSTPFNRGTEVHPRAEQFSQELRLSGQVGSIDWLAGFYYFDYEIDGRQARCSPGTCATNRNPVIYQLETDSWALFGNVDIPLTEQLSLTAGLRYTEEEKEYALDNQDFGLVFNTTTVGDRARQDDDNVSFNVRLNWTPHDDLLVYGGVSRGHKSGTFNVGFTPINFDAIPVDPEELTSYEGGIKSTLLEDRLQLNGAVFYYDYKDSQAFQFDGRTLSATAFNRDAEVTGFEIELAATPLDGLSVFANATYLDATLKDVELPGPGFAGLPPRDTVMPLAPEWKVNILGRYEWPVPWGGRMALQGNVTYFDEQFFDAFNSPSQFEDSYAVADARLSWYSADDKWKVSVFAENIADTEYRTYSFDLAFLGFSTDVYGKPQWIGATVGYSF